MNIIIWGFSNRGCIVRMAVCDSIRAIAMCMGHDTLQYQNAIMTSLVHAETENQQSLFAQPDHELPVLRPQLPYNCQPSQYHSLYLQPHAVVHNSH